MTAGICRSTADTWRWLSAVENVLLLDDLRYPFRRKPGAFLGPVRVVIQDCGKDARRLEIAQQAVNRKINMSSQLVKQDERLEGVGTKCRVCVTLPAVRCLPGRVLKRAWKHDQGEFGAQLFVREVGDVANTLDDRSRQRFTFPQRLIHYQERVGRQAEDALMRPPCPLKPCESVERFF